MQRLRHLAFAAALFSGLAAIPLDARAETPVERGKYLVGIMDCGGCHTTGALTGKPEPTGYLAGADIGWAIPNIGVVYPRNITPDKETGIGSWSTDDIIKLLRTGTRPDGREVAPIMNWRSYGTLTDIDIHALAAYLRSIPAVTHVTFGPTAMQDVKTPYFTVAKP
jgi:mono/diheme cytochrome c family protein